MGGLDFDPDTQDLYHGEVVGMQYADLDVSSAALLRRHNQPLGRLLHAVSRVLVQPHAWNPHSAGRSAAPT